MLHGDKAAQKTEKFKSFNQLMKWCSDAAQLDVRCNADNPEQTENALAFGAVGIGLTRTEHMFFEGNRIDSMREMILADNLEDRKAALAKLLPYQREDFTGILRRSAASRRRSPARSAAARVSATHERAADGSREDARHQVEFIQQRVAQLHEFNPMLGHRGCRLGIAYPEITEMQVRAIFEAAADVARCASR
jgi:pyruvate,orthophosphate dikinase